MFPGLKEDTQRFDATFLSYAETGRFSPLINDYLNGNPTLTSLAAYTPDLKGLEEAVHQIESFTFPRAELGKTLREQYRDIEQREAVEANITALENSGLAIVTAHQLNLFTGPLYVLYKTISTIALSRRLNREFPDKQFVPVFWLGSEDHDWEEIRQFHLLGNTYRWEGEAAGSTGNRSVEGLEAIYNALKEKLGPDTNAQSLLHLFSSAYLEESGNLAHAQRKLLHALFGSYGLVVLDADVSRLKALQKSWIRRELESGFAAKALAPALAQLEASWHVQASPREINLFYRTDQTRERIDRKGEDFVLSESEQTFKRQELFQLLEKFPERFSPNVILRPLQQQQILPAIAFLGGGAEVAYWLPLRRLFEEAGLFMPVVLLRNSALWIDAGGVSRCRQLKLSLRDLFRDPDQLIRDWVKDQETVELDWQNEKQQIDQVFDSLVEKAKGIDVSLMGKVEAERAAQQNGLEKIGQRLIKAAKQRHETELNQIRKLQGKYFPDGGLQERVDHFGMLWLRYGPEFIDVLLRSFDPLDGRFTLIAENPDHPSD